MVLHFCDIMLLLPDTMSFNTLAKWKPNFHSLRNLQPTSEVSHTRFWSAYLGCHSHCNKFHSLCLAVSEQILSAALLSLHGRKTSKWIIFIHVGQTYFSAESVTKLLRKFLKHNLTQADFLSVGRIFFLCSMTLNLWCHPDTVDVLDIHRGLGLQQERQQLCGARQSGVVQRREAVRERGDRVGQGMRQGDERCNKSSWRFYSRWALLKHQIEMCKRVCEVMLVWSRC